MPRSVSEKQLAANRANAAKSTGPRTPEGKSRSAQNVRTHGLTSETFAILRIEDREEIDRIRAETIACYQPANSEELFALQRIAICKVAIVRAARLEAGLFTCSLDIALNDDNITPFVPLHPDLQADRAVAVEQSRNFALAEGFHRMAGQTNAWSLLLRYQAQVERQYRRAVEEFDRVKALRNELPNEAVLDSQPEENVPLTPPAGEPIPSPSRGPEPRPPGDEPVSTPVPQSTAAPSPSGPDPQEQRVRRLALAPGRHLQPVRVCHAAQRADARPQVLHTRRAKRRRGVQLIAGAARSSCEKARRRNFLQIGGRAAQQAGADAGAAGTLRGGAIGVGSGTEHQPRICATPLGIREKLAFRSVMPAMIY